MSNQYQNSVNDTFSDSASGSHNEIRQNLEWQLDYYFEIHEETQDRLNDYAKAPEKTSPQDLSLLYYAMRDLSIKSVDTLSAIAAAVEINMIPDESKPDFETLKTFIEIQLANSQAFMNEMQLAHPDMQIVAAPVGLKL